jgi:streptogramin lyase
MVFLADKSMYYDIKEVGWKDPETNRLYRVTGFTQVDDIDVVWYQDRGTGEVHCMDSNMFTLKLEACGSLVKELSE